MKMFMYFKVCSAKKGIGNIKNYANILMWKKQKKKAALWKLTVHIVQFAIELPM